jgi:prepilin-type N-terminal cleavage/methylation domain-containing protein
MSNAPGQKSGFALIEILATLIVAAIMGAALLAAQRESFFFYQAAADNNKCLNVAQEIMAGETPARKKMDIPSYTSFKGRGSGKWLIKRSETEFENIYSYSLKVRAGREFTFKFYGP